MLAAEGCEHGALHMAAVRNFLATLRPRTHTNLRLLSLRCI